jgi:hypothetical protein
VSSLPSLVRSVAESCPAKDAFHGGEPFREACIESADNEQQVETLSHVLFEGTVRLTGDPLLPVAPDGPPASLRHDDSHSIARGTIASKQELEPTCFGSSRGLEQALDLSAVAESFLPSKASSHLRR